ncbi:MAG: molybdate ABC transporter substrate-binding protein [Alphaproteobacteria bacterium]|nr:molybdate ABC transporter substrate-binding protein [Alphaproteobacteria bacterium]
MTPSLSMAAVALAAIVASCPIQASADDITVFAAASMKNAMDEVAARWADATGNTAVVSLGGSSELARQIQQGAPADIFISASPDWMDTLDEGGLVAAGTRFDLLGNTLVLIAHGTDVPPVAITPGFDLAGLLGDGRLAMALVDAVPAGVYGKAALTSLGVWDTVAPDVAQVNTVRAALAFVSTGEAPLGIVYATDAAADDRVSVIGTFPEDSHPPIIYPAAAMAASDNPLNGDFLAFLRSDSARQAFERQGFRVIAD